MKILALDTSGTIASAALMDEYIVMAESSVTLSNGGPSASETLLPMVDKLFKTTKLSLEDVDYIACTCGPGSFTGLRIGAATAKGLAFASGKPLIAVPTLDAMAYTITSLSSSSIWAVPMMDARRGQVYSAIYCGDNRTTDYLAEPVEVVLQMLKDKIEPSTHIAFMGNGAILHRNLITNESWPEGITLSFQDRNSAASVGGNALTMAGHGDYIAEKDFSLMYIRKPQAQRELEGKAK
ncbi:MAG: tRNA (adenosine(37)-N6)-threonylcarbamoyltransferase complex dimerization subunit type 1 TsaB [Defluviitaleaceae bacterium]|nr:tRNA (adenosine(37)-N6)-threonylcarbamoyltransferase complex dimerization subunit type 1 TsaB [Defluviitaleaceae bacterium]